MVALVDKSIRDTIGIDSSERAIVFAAFLLRNSYLQESLTDLKDYFQISPSIALSQNNLIQKIIVIATIKYSTNALTLAGDILNNIVEKSVTVSNYSGANLQSSDNIITPIIDDPVGLDSLEKYFYWNCQRILINNLSGKINSVSILPVYKGTNDVENSIRISVSIDYNGLHFLETNNLIESIGIAQNEFTPFLSNEFNLSNEAFLSN